MNYQNFIESVTNHMQKILDEGQTVVVQPVLKNNGTIYDGLIIIDPILNISPTIYLNPYYHRHLNGVPMDDIYEDILKTYHDHLPAEDFDVSTFKDFTKAKNHIVMKLVNAERNHVLLQDVPHIIYYDLAIVFVCAVTDFLDEYATILIHNQHLALWNITVDELYKIAEHNTPRLLSPRLDNMEMLLDHLIDQPLPFLAEINMNILTNHLKIHGATVMVYPGLLEELGEIFEDNLIIIPSSIHEVLIIPEQNVAEEYTLEDFNEMIAEVNETQLTDDEILSDHAYRYNRITKELEY